MSFFFDAVGQAQDEIASPDNRPAVRSYYRTGEGEYSTSPSGWSPTSTAGRSVSGQQTPTGGVQPPAGTAVNGWTPASFTADGQTFAWSGGVIASNHVSRAAGTLAVLYMPKTGLPAPDAGGAYWKDPMLLGDDGEAYNEPVVGMTVSTAGVRGYLWDGTNVIYTNPISLTNDTWNYCYLKWDSTTLTLGVARDPSSDIATSSVSAGAIGAVRDYPLVIGEGTGAGPRGDILEIFTQNEAIADSDVVLDVAYFNDRYALSLPSTFTSTGTLNRTLATVTLSTAGGPRIAATLSKTLGAATLSSTGTVSDPARVGTLSQTLGAATLASTAKPIVDADLAKTLGAATLSSAGNVRVAGTLNRTLSTVTLATVGEPVVDADLSKTLATVTLATAGGPRVTGTLSKTLGAATLSSTAKPIVDGDLAKTLAAASLGGGGGNISTTLGSRLYAWYKNYTLGNWDDADGGTDATQGTGSLQPAVQTTTGGQSYPDFDGGDRLLGGQITALPTHSAGYHYIFGALIRVDVAGLQWIFGTDTTNQYVNSSNKLQFAGSESNAAVNDGVWRRVIVTKNGSSGTVTMYINGVAQTVTSTEAFGSDWRSSTQPWFGDRPGGGYPLNGAIASLFLGCDTTTAFSGTDVSNLDADLSIILNGGGSAVGDVDIAATLSKTLGTATSSSTGTVRVTGTLSKTLAVSTLSSEGTNGDPSRIGTLNKTLGTATLSSTAKPIVDADLSRTLATSTLSSTGDLDVDGDLSRTLGTATLSSAGNVRVTAALSRTLGTATLASAGNARVTGTLSRTLGASTLSSTGDLDVAATLSKTLATPTLATVGEPVVDADLAKTLGAATLSATGGQMATGTLAQTLATSTLASTGNVRIAASLSKTLATTTLSGDADVRVVASLSKTLATTTLASAATARVAGALSKTLATTTLASVGDLDISGSVSKTLGAATSSSTGTVRVVATLSKTLDATSLFASSGTLRLASLSKVLDQATFTGAGAVRVAGSLSKTLASATLASTGTARIGGALSRTLTATTLSSVGDLPIQGTCSTALSGVLCSSTGDLDLTATLSKTLEEATLVGIGPPLEPDPLGDDTLVATGQVLIRATAAIQLGALLASTSIRAGVYCATITPKVTGATLDSNPNGSIIVPIVIHSRM